MITEYTNYTKQNVPENIKAAGLNFSSLDISEEARGYLDIDTDMCNQVKDELKDFLEAEVNTTIPVCVLSHMFDQKRSKFLVQLKAEASLRDLDRKYYIFTYEDQKELYDEFEEERVSTYQAFLAVGFEKVENSFITKDNKKVKVVKLKKVLN